MEENNKSNRNNDLLRQILSETSSDSHSRPNTERKPFVRHEASPASHEAPKFDETEKDIQDILDNEIERADHFEDKTTIHRVVKPQPETVQRTVVKKDDSLYDDLDGISQTKAQRRISSQSKGKKKKKSKGMRALRSIILTVFILVISVFLAYLIITYGRDVLGINNDNTTKIVTIPQGADTEEIAELLEKEGIITYPKLFTTFAGFSGKDIYFTAGDHELRPDMAYDTIFENLASPSLGSEDVVEIAFPEGITLVGAADLLEEQEVCDSDEFIDYFNNNSQFGLAYEQYLPSFTTDKFYKMEGYLFPDTYQFYIGMDVDLVCQKILKNFNSKITERDYERMEELGISLDETLTLASMIQHEAGSVDQMSRISSVFWNRLNNPETYPKLQSDPTSNYVEEVIKPHIDEYNETIFDAYDTYICNGLPAGAICNPGTDAIQAALYPADTDYFYFYSNINTKETYFSRTLEEHEAWIDKVNGNQYVATTPDQTIPGETTEPVVAGVGTSTGTNTDTTTTQVVNGNIW